MTKGLRVSNLRLNVSVSGDDIVDEVQFAIEPGKVLALVGESGSGKTTVGLAVLGHARRGVSIAHGHVHCGDTEVLGLDDDAKRKIRGDLVSYVPQDVLISNGSIRENVALGYPIEVATDELVLEALTVAKLNDFVQELPNGTDTMVGERGTKISGGQRQRLGIARAMFTKPHLLVLDEATSSLDGETEASISAAIHALRGTTTVVMIAHRLSTVRNADIVVYMAEGKVVATGTFDEVRNSVPDFNRQAKLMGL